jgi:hypothetical protein
MTLPLPLFCSRRLQAILVSAFDHDGKSEKKSAQSHETTGP